jgi:hypothetical protein
MEKIRKYNASFSFVSFNANQDKNLSKSNVYTLRIQGQIHHRIGPLIPNENSAITCGAVYFHGQNEVEARQNYSSGLNPFLLMQIQSLLTDECKNPFIEQFKKAAALAKGKN